MATPELTTDEIGYVWHQMVPYTQAKDACLPTVTRSIISMVEGEEVTPSPEGMDQLLGRTDGEPVFGRPDLLYLLSRGYELYEISGFSDPRFIEEGKPYLEEFHGIYSTDPDVDPDQFQCLYGDSEVISALQKSAQREHAIRTMNKNWHRENRLPGVDDIVHLLKTFGVVQIISHSADRGSPTKHSELVGGYMEDLDTTEEAFFVYSPEEDATEGMIWELGRTELEESLSPCGGIVSVRPSSSMGIDYRYQTA